MVNQDELKKDLDNILIEVAKKQSIKNYELYPNVNADCGDGFESQFFTGKVRNKDTGELTNVAIKRAPLNVWDYEGIFKNENLFYSTLFPALDSLQKETSILKPFDHVPNFFCAGMEPKKQFIAMENLTPYGYTMFDKKQSLDKEHLEFIFKLYGKFHAISYVLRNKNLETYQQLTEECTNAFPMIGEFAGNQMRAAVSATVKTLNLEENNGLFEAGQYLAEHAKQTFLKASEYHGDLRCITHGDCWSNNMLFKYSESGKLLDVKLLDFQLCRESTPVHDLSFCFYSGASKKDMDILEYYLEIYYKTFREFSKELGGDPDKLFSFEVLVREWRENALLGVMLGLWLWQIKLVSKEECKQFISEHEGLGQEEELKLWDIFLEKIYKSDLYKERTTPLLIHAYDYGILRRDKFVEN